MQDIVINIHIEYDATQAIATDDIKHALDYKVITKKLIKEVEASQYYLIEKLADRIADIVLESPLAAQTQVRVDKPFALRFADSVSFTLNKTR